MAGTVNIAQSIFLAPQREGEGTINERTLKRLLGVSILVSYIASFADEVYASDTSALGPCWYWPRIALCYATKEMTVINPAFNKDGVTRRKAQPTTSSGARKTTLQLNPSRSCS